jgi:predicted aldo/keto reductase-like oxidoreductase
MHADGGDHQLPGRDRTTLPVVWMPQSPASLGWIWNHPENTVILSGMSNDGHIDENLALADKAMRNAFSGKAAK